MPVRGASWSRKCAADLLRHSEDGSLRLSPAYLRQLCKEMDQYTTPALNDQLYLHFKGFRKIEALDEYTGLKCLWLEGNGLPELEGLDALTELRGLYVQQNLIREIKNIHMLTNLDSLNLAENSISTIAGLSALTKLNTLNLSKNRLSDFASLCHLLECPSIGVLDLSHNSIDGQECWRIFHNMPNLKVLNLMGNKIKSTTKQYRKSTIVGCKALTYLDDRPVFPKERACAEAFMEGGRDAERAAREAFVQAERDRQMRGVQHVLEIRDRARRAIARGDADCDPDRTDSETEAEADDDGDREKQEGDAGYEDWQFGEKPHKPNVYDQMSGKVQTDLSNWEPHPDLMDERAEILADQAAARSTRPKGEITGPKAADIELFGDDDEYDVVDAAFMESYQPPARAAHVAATGREACKVPRKKMLIEEVCSGAGASEKPSPEPVVEDTATSAAEPMIELIAPKRIVVEQGDEDEDDIPEEIVGKGAKKWFQIGDDEPKLTPQHPARIVDLSGADEAPPPLEEVDLATGSVVSTVFSDPPAAASSKVPPRRLIEVIGGDDMDSLD